MIHEIHKVHFIVLREKLFWIGQRRQRKSKKCVHTISIYSTPMQKARIILSSNITNCKQLKDAFFPIASECILFWQINKANLKTDDQISKRRRNDPC